MEGGRAKTLIKEGEESFNKTYERATRSYVKICQNIARDDALRAMEILIKEKLLQIDFYLLLKTSQKLKDMVTQFYTSRYLKVI